MKKKIEKIAREDGRFPVDALRFIHEGLGYAVKKMGDEPDHISGQRLCYSLGELALEKWGRLAKMVLNNWGIKTTRHFGDIVYLMIENKWMSAQPDDSIDDFNNVYDFETVFKKDFKFQDFSE